MAGKKTRAVRALCWAALRAPSERHDETLELAIRVLEATGIQGAEAELGRIRAQEERGRKLLAAGQELAIQKLEDRIEGLENGDLERRSAWLDGKLSGLEEEVRTWTTAAGQNLAGIRVRLDRLEAKAVEPRALEERFLALETRWEEKRGETLKLIRDLTSALDFKIPELATKVSLAELAERLENRMQFGKGALSGDGLEGPCF